MFLFQYYKTAPAQAMKTEFAPFEGEITKITANVRVGYADFAGSGKIVYDTGKPAEVVIRENGKNINLDTDSKTGKAYNSTTIYSERLECDPAQNNGAHHISVEAKMLTGYFKPPFNTIWEDGVLKNMKVLNMSYDYLQNFEIGAQKLMCIVVSINFEGEDAQGGKQKSKNIMFVFDEKNIGEGMGAIIYVKGEEMLKPRVIFFGNGENSKFNGAKIEGSGPIAEIQRGGSDVWHSMEEEKREVLLYPNPAKEGARLEYFLEKNSDVSLTLANTSGTVIWQKNERQMGGREQEIGIDTKDLPAGEYFVTLTYGNERHTEKLIVEK